MELPMANKHSAAGTHTEGCMVCGKELIYAEENRKLHCNYCGQEIESTIYCPEGHFVCDNCHRADSSQIIEIIIERSTETNPIILAQEIMNSPVFNMHGPEHHMLVPAVLLASLRNLGIAVDQNQIRDALFRSKGLPGGICGSWGACGAAIGAGIGISVLHHLTALKKEGWGQTNQDVGKILNRVGAYGGPRCCKRSTYSALLEAVNLLEINGEASFPKEAHEPPICKDFWRNKQCLKDGCPYYPTNRKD